MVLGKAAVGLELTAARMDMPIKILEYTEAMTGAVMDFNRRIRAGGGRLLFPTSPVPAWLPRLPGRKLYQEYFVALDAQAMVRGAYILKHREFAVRGDLAQVGDFQLPISEGSVDRAYAGVAVQMLRDALQRQPVLFALGMGGYREALPRLLRASGWKLSQIPFFFRILHPNRFLRNIAFLRRWRLAAGLMDSLALSGLGWLGIKTLHAVHHGRMAPKCLWPASCVSSKTAQPIGRPSRITLSRMNFRSSRG